MHRARMATAGALKQTKKLVAIRQTILNNHAKWPHWLVSQTGRMAAVTETGPFASGITSICSRCEAWTSREDSIMTVEVISCRGRILPQPHVVVSGPIVKLTQHPAVVGTTLLQTHP